MSLFVLRQDVEALREQAADGDDVVAAVLERAEIVDGPVSRSGPAEKLIGAEIWAIVNGRKQRYVVGGCVIPGNDPDEDRVPYTAPIVAALAPAEEGAERVAVAAGRRFRIKIIRVSLPGSVAAA